MEVYDIYKHGYAEHRERALRPEGTQKDIDTLGKWFSLYGEIYWNGECYDADGVLVYPVWEEGLDEDGIGNGSFTCVGYEIRQMGGANNE